MSEELDPAIPEAVRAIRETMECIVLPVRPGAPVSGKPPIEIFLGTEPAQYRANRVFMWSIEKVRDPGREVRIHVMSELEGFDRRGWTTGFTNYRFAIPALAGERGRAIYNDEDQIYLTDPGVLFDHEMGDAGHLSISDTESSVMLIDCARMASVWTLDDAQHAWKRSLLRKASGETGIRGDLDPGWNARDEEYEPGVSHLLHYTTLHTQPWRPFPERFVYQKGSYTDLWHELEAEAIDAGFEPFSRDAPSRGFDRHVERLRALPTSEPGSAIGLAGEVAGAVEALVRRTKSRAISELVPDLRGVGEQVPGRFGLDREDRSGLLEWLAAKDDGVSADGVLCVDGLEALPVWDVPWIVEELFARADRFVFAAVRCAESKPRRRLLLPPQGTAHTPEWWRSHFEAAAHRHPGVSWELITARGNEFQADRIVVRSGGPRPDASPPSVWTLTDGEPGNETQVEALADALSWPAEKKVYGFGPTADLPFSGQGASLRGISGSAPPEPPWPDLLIVAGRRVAPVARWIREQAGGRTRVVALGVKAATPADSVDLAVTQRGSAVFPHPHRFEIDCPLVAERIGDARSGHGAASRWRERIQAIGGTRIAVVIGSGTHQLGLDARTAEALGRRVRESAEGLGASVLVSASRHADREVFSGCLRGLGEVAFVHHETRDQRPSERAWSEVLEAADVFVMVGLGETMLTEVCTTGRPVFLSPQLEVRVGFWPRLRDRFAGWVVARAQARPANDRGTTRPQEGLELLCAKLVDGGWVRPRRDFEALRGRLVRGGIARLFRAPIRAGDLEGFSPPLESEATRVAARIRDMFGVSSTDQTGTQELNR